MGDLSDEEALQLLGKKFKPTEKADYRELITDFTRTPFVVELVATILNKGLMPLSELIENIQSSPESAFAKAFIRLFESLSSFQKQILYFVGSFRPPEIPRLWIRSLIEWRGDDEELYEIAPALESLTELSLLAYVSSTNVYKMPGGVQDLVAA